MTEQELREKIADRIREGGNLSAFDVAWFILELIKQANYVRLAGDQSLPNGPGANDDYALGFNEGQQDMLKARFKKVE